ncbi:MAG: hypothetical protein ACK5KU_02910 [Beutenbergiaceae bacterium]
MNHFEEYVQAAQQHMQEPQEAPERVKLPDWHTPLIAELQRAKVPHVQAYRSLPVQSVQRPMRTDQEVHSFERLTDGWALKYVLNYLDDEWGSTHSFFINSEHFYSDPYWGESFESSSHRSNNGRSYRNVYVGIPKSGAWVVNSIDGSTGLYDTKGAALIVAQLRQGRRLRADEHGSFKVHAPEHGSFRESLDLAW